MKKIVLGVFMALLFLGCGSNATTKNVTQKLVVGNSLENLKLNNQHEKPSALPKDTKIVFFSFSKAVGHKCNALLESKESTFITKHHVVYIADVSPAPSIIKNMFILPDLKKLEFPILLINNDKLSSEFTKGMKKDKIVVVYLNNLKITKIKNVDDVKELEQLILKS
jgi:uncharacterized protein YcfL